MSDYLKTQQEANIMEQLITQVKYTKEGEFSREVYALCTLEDEETKSWKCEFKKMSLTEIAKVIVDFFDSTSISAKSLSFTLFKKDVTVCNKSSSKYDYQHYLEDICFQLVIE